MSNFVFNGHNVYYEEHGHGEPLVILNGIFMSCASWSAFLPTFAANFRTILVDMMDQGKSDKMSHEYTQDLQIELVAALFEHMNLSKAHVCGISYGGEVAMSFAGKYPDKVDRMILANTTAVTTNWLRDIGRSWEYAFDSRDGRQFFKTCIPIVYSPMFYDQNYEWAQRREDMFVQTLGAEVYDAFGRLTRSAETHDARHLLPKITAPTLIISAEHDYVTPPYQQKEMAQLIPNAHHITIQDAGHAVMYERPTEFATAVIGFLRIRGRINIVG